ncbi:hypothetical protein [Simiduia aestuariiviva]|uniref:Uncharacterized protein n=1 Tax=Simiduia aestuariiviva TaxID=1510459 RepID=A0A839UXW3_9GAMM|nr:hypothetical protein [Simiduia aestuariiviva]MBB3170165.1 hypothetical protein [Simiduia aestuariiviva]
MNKATTKFLSDEIQEILKQPVKKAWLEHRHNLPFDDAFEVRSRQIALDQLKELVLSEGLPSLNLAEATLKIDKAREKLKKLQNPLTTSTPTNGGRRKLEINLFIREYLSSFPDANASACWASLRKHHLSHRNEQDFFGLVIEAINNEMLEWTWDKTGVGNTTSKAKFSQYFRNTKTQLKKVCKNV